MTLHRPLAAVPGRVPWALLRGRPTVGGLPDLTARTPYGAVDLVPLLRRLQGDKTVDIPTGERTAGAWALGQAGLGLEQIADAVGLSAESVNKALKGTPRRPPRPKTTPAQAARRRELQRAAAARRRAGRVMDDGRLVHPDAEHGTNSAYVSYGCQCIPCTDAHKHATARARQGNAARRRAARPTGGGS